VAARSRADERVQCRCRSVQAGDVGTALAVVISHDCDLAQKPETEPSVEIIVARRVEAANGNFTHAKNARRLHLECSIDGATTYLDMQAQGKTEIKKTLLADHAPSANVVVKPEARSSCNGARGPVSARRLSG